MHKKNEPGGLTEKKRRFCEEYIVDSNGAQAAIRAGYSPNGARVQAARLLRQPEVCAYVEELRAPIKEQNMITTGEVIAGLRSEARDMDNGTASSRVSAWGKLGQHLGMFTDKIEANLTSNEVREVRLVVVPAAARDDRDLDKKE